MKSTDGANRALSLMTQCVEDVRTWMTQSLLKLNEDKTEFLVVSSPYYQEIVRHTTMAVGDAVISSSEQCRNLGVIFDSKMNLKQHVSSVCRSAFFQLRKIGIIRRYLSDDSCATLVHSFVTSRLDYCNSLLANLPNCVLSKLQKVQNVAARILTRRRDFHDISPVLIEIYWLPIPLRIRYKINLITFKCLHDLGPPYLKKLLSPYQPKRNLRSATKGELERHGFKLETYGRRAYFVVAPHFWNDLPINLRFEDNLNSFKSGLKTHLFTLFTDRPDLYVF